MALLMVLYGFTNRRRKTVLHGCVGQVTVTDNLGGRAERGGTAGTSYTL